MTAPNPSASGSSSASPSASPANANALILLQVQNQHLAELATAMRLQHATLLQIEDHSRRAARYAQSCRTVLLWFLILFTIPAMILFFAITDRSPRLKGPYGATQIPYDTTQSSPTPPAAHQTATVLRPAVKPPIG